MMKTFIVTSFFFCVFTLILLFLPFSLFGDNSVQASSTYSYTCQPPGECVNRGGVLVGDGKDTCGGSCAGDCCRMSMFQGKNWTQLFWGTSTTPKSLKLLGINLTPEDIESLVKNGFYLGAAGLFLGFTGIAIYGGGLWILSGDNEGQLTKAKGVIKSGGIGLGIVFVFMVVLGVMAVIMGIDLTSNLDLGSFF